MSEFVRQIVPFVHLVPIGDQSGTELLLLFLDFNRSSYTPANALKDF